MTTSSTATDPAPFDPDFQPPNFAQTLSDLEQRLHTLELQQQCKCSAIQNHLDYHEQFCPLYKQPPRRRDCPFCGNTGLDQSTAHQDAYNATVYDICLHCNGSGHQLEQWQDGHLIWS